LKKFEGLLFCTDLDGTLYKNDKTVSPQNLEAIEYFKSEGGRFTFITGRVPATSRSICEIIKPNAPYGCINGGGIYDLEKKDLIWSLSLPNEALELVTAVKEAMPDIGIQLNPKSGIYFHRDNPAMEYFRQVTGVPFITCEYEDLREPLLKIVFAHNDEAKISALAEFLAAQPLADQFDFIRSERRLYEILPKGASKGASLMKMAEILKIDPKKTIAVGDYNNDISMIRDAALGFAVANAVDEAKAVADHITVSNEENAIATIINGLDRGEFLI